MGFLFLILYPGSPPPRLLLPPPPHTTSSHTIFHTQLCQPPSFTHNFVNHHLSHTVFHIQLCQPPSFTHNFVTHHLSRNFVNHIQPPSLTHHLSHTPHVTHHLSHTTLSTTIFHTQLCQPPSDFVNHHLSHTVVLRGRRGTHGTEWRAWARLVARDAAAFCVAGVAQPYIHLHFTWQAWHNLTSTIVSRGRRGTHGTPWRLSLVWARVPPRHFAWQAWHNLHPPSFTWQAWHKLTSSIVSRGRHGTHGTPWRAWVWFGRT